MKFTNTIGTACALSVFLGGVACTTNSADAAFTQRFQATQKGGFVLVGNTLGQDGGPGIPPPIVGNVGSPGSFSSDIAPDLYWRSDSPFSGAATADFTVNQADARSTANLAIPFGSTITHAQLYWSGKRTTDAADQMVTFSRDGGFSSTVTADAFATNASIIGPYYQSTADVTNLVQTAGQGTFRLETTAQSPLLGINDENIYTGWSLVVAYSNSLEPTRQITIQDGLDFLWANSSAPLAYSVTRPSVGIGTAQMGIVMYDGDGFNPHVDAVTVNSLPLFDAVNPVNNIFNSTYSRLGVSASSLGDLPQLTGLARSMSGIDIDTFDVTAMLGSSLTLNTDYTSSEIIFSGVLATALPVEGVPEPATFALIALGAFGGLGLRRRCDNPSV